jgi:hypothetical protein
MLMFEALAIVSVVIGTLAAIFAIEDYIHRLRERCRPPGT